MADVGRARRLAGRIKQIVATVIETQIKDPRLGMVTITDVRVTGDLQNATVFYTAYGSDDDRAASAAALESAKGRLRTAVGKALGIRLTPTLEFIPDALPEGAAHLEDVLVATRAADAELARSREGAVYAGDPDPYKKPDDDLDDEPDAR
jgi:ribosome-binding factor A